MKILNKNPFKNLQFEFLPNFKEERTQKFTTIVLTVITLAFFGIFAINPTISTIVKLRKELDDNNLVDQRLVEKINNLSTLQKKYAALQTDLSSIFSAIPKNSEVPLLAAQVQAVSQDTKVGIGNFQSFEVGVQKEPTARNYYSFSFTLSSEGSYNDLYKFLTKLTNMQRVISVELISLTKKSNSPLFELSIRGKALFNP